MATNKKRWFKIRRSLMKIHRRERLFLVFANAFMSNKMSGERKAKYTIFPAVYVYPVDPFRVNQTLLLMPEYIEWTTSLE